MLDRVRRDRRVRRRIDAVPFWWHSIDVGGITTPGVKTPEELRHALAGVDLPDVRGRSVLDIGGWDGFFAFEAERAGAARVAVIDHYMWSLDLPGMVAYWERCKAESVAPRPYHETEYWHPDTLPGKAGFDTARALRGSRVEAIVGDFMTTDLEALGQWDVVLYLGVLYHMENPVLALRRLFQVTRERAIIETEAAVIPRCEHQALWRFFPGAELNADVSNWWAPNMAALAGALPAVGFSQVEVKRGPSREQVETPGPDPVHYRAVVHAIKEPPRSVS
jgi:tRNA (mo5U34)-methyltransferase